MSIPLRGRKAGMTEQFLDGPQVGAGFEHMRGKAVPKRMRSLLSAENPVFFYIFLKYAEQYVVSSDFPPDR